MSTLKFKLVPFFRNGERESESESETKRDRAPPLLPNDLLFNEIKYKKRKRKRKSVVVSE